MKQEIFNAAHRQSLLFTKLFKLRYPIHNNTLALSQDTLNLEKVSYYNTLHNKAFQAERFSISPSLFTLVLIRIVSMIYPTQFILPESNDCHPHKSFRSLDDR